MYVTTVGAIFINQALYKLFIVCEVVVDIARIVWILSESRHND